MGKNMKKKSCVGVRTRARTLALNSSIEGFSFLQLRSRRLQKHPIGENKRKGVQKEKKIAGKNGNPRENEVEMVVEASFGENLLEFEGVQRSARETTPCSLIRDPDTIELPISPNKRNKLTHTHRRRGNVTTPTISTARETDAFFGTKEKKQQQEFIKKYNYDPVNDMPLPGRYEWVKVDP